MAVVAPFKVGDVIRRRTKAGTYERVERLFRVVFINTKGINGGVFQAEPADDTGTSWWAGPLPAPSAFEFVSTSPDASKGTSDE